MSPSACAERLKRLELSRLLTELVWCYKIVFRLVRVNTCESLNLVPRRLLVDIDINCLRNVIAASVLLFL